MVSRECRNSGQHWPYTSGHYYNGSESTLSNVPANTSLPMYNHDGTEMLDHHGRIVYRSQYLSTHPLRSDCKERVGYAGRKFVYLSGDGAIRTMNEIFGHTGWSSEVTMEKEVQCEKDDMGRWVIGYVVTVKVTLAENGVFHEDCGSGDGINDSKVKACEKAFKSAVTDAMKRAVRHFGERLGNALYVKGNGMRTAPIDNKKAIDELDRKTQLAKFGDQKELRKKFMAQIPGTSHTNDTKPTNDKNAYQDQTTQSSNLATSECNKKTFSAGNEQIVNHDNCKNDRINNTKRFQGTHNNSSQQANQHLNVSNPHHQLNQTNKAAYVTPYQRESGQNQVGHISPPSESTKPTQHVSETNQTNRSSLHSFNNNQNREGIQTKTPLPQCWIPSTNNNKMNTNAATNPNTRSAVVSASSSPNYTSFSSPKSPVKNTVTQNTPSTNHLSTNYCANGYTNATIQKDNSVELSHNISYQMGNGSNSSHNFERSSVEQKRCMNHMNDINCVSEPRRKIARNPYTTNNLR